MITVVLQQLPTGELISLVHWKQCAKHFTVSDTLADTGSAERWIEKNVRNAIAQTLKSYLRQRKHASSHTQHQLFCTRLEYAFKDAGTMPVRKLADMVVKQRDYLMAIAPGENGLQRGWIPTITELITYCQENQLAAAGQLPAKKHLGSIIFKNL